MSNSLNPKFLQFNTQLGPQWLVPGLQVEQSGDTKPKGIQKPPTTNKRHTVVGRCTLQGVQSVGKTAVFNLPKQADIK